MSGVIICDLDGTLIDSRKDLATGVNLMRAEYSLSPLDLPTITDFVGNGARKLGERALEGVDVDIEEALLLMKKHYGAHMFDETIVYPTVEEGLLLLKDKGYKLAVATNKPQEPCEKILNHLEIGKYFDIILGASQRYALKSDPAMLLGAIDETNSDINKSWMVGDNYTDLELNVCKLIKHDLETGIETELANNVKIITQPKWSKKGWIAFDNVFDQNYQIWIIKDNGDSLTQFTNKKYNFYPVWDAVGTNLYWRHSPVLGVPTYFLKQGLYNSNIDTIMANDDIYDGYTSYNDISINNILVSNIFINNNSHIACTSINNISFNSLINLNEEDLYGLTGLSWSNNNEIVYFTVYNNSHNDGLFKIDIISGNYEKLIEFCNSKRYKQISCSNNGEKIIGERIDSYLIKNSENEATGEIVENSSIYLIDLITFEETKVNIIKY